MKAAVIHQYGGPEVLEYEDVPDPVPGPGEVLVKVAAASINPIDIIQRSGGLQATWPMQFPGILGWDFSGTIVQIADGVTGLRVGEKVAAWAYNAYAELVAAKADLLARVPDGLDLVDAGALPLVTITGSQLVSEAAHVKQTNTVLVSGAVGSVGRAAVYTAMNVGAHVIAGVTKRQLEEAKQTGADEVLALDDAAAFAAQPQVDVVANLVRGATAAALMAKVKPGGTFASATGAPENAKDYPLVKVAAFHSHQDALLLAMLMQAVRDKKFSIPIDRRIPLRDAGEGQAALAKGGLKGKILLIP
ncbi:MAG TPA: NADP-dependent oxidoreductase [Candidatus Acidoferrales bacterium]|nr:NADP-dependent oxidoreductase [Candidatus Acidoferrales bacterium]